MLNKEVDDWKKILEWIKEKNKGVKRNTSYGKKLKMIDKELEEMKFVMSEDERDRIVRKNINELKYFGRDLTAAREKLIELENSKLVEKVEKTKIEVEEVKDLDARQK